MNKIKSLIHITLYSILLLLSGCTSTSSFQGEPQETKISPSAKTYLQQAAQSQGTQQQYLQLQAVNQLLADHNINDAQQLLNTLKSIHLDPTIQQQRQILEAQLALTRNEPKLAIKQLHQVQALKSLPIDAQVAYYITAIEGYQRSNNLAYSTLARISLSALLHQQGDALSRLSTAGNRLFQPQIATLKNSAQEDAVIWQNLQSLSQNEVTTLLNRSNASLLRGWFALALLAKQNANHPTALMNQIQAWQQRYPNHPAQTILPDQDHLAMAAQPLNPTQIALLLPLHGKLASMGQAVRDGFMTVFYDHQSQLQPVPTIKLYDTSENTDISALYAQAIQEGAQIVIGPLTKQNVASLAQNATISVPTIALNYLPDNVTAPQDFIQFGLSPLQAASQMADAIWQHNANRLLMIVPKNDWGTNVAEAFYDQWQQYNGKVMLAYSFSNQDNMSVALQKILNIDQSQTRINAIQQILKEKVKSLPRRRQDINGIFIIAHPNEGRQILPLLKYYFAGNLPTFSLSTVYTGIPDRFKDRDLNGVYFNDMPWLLSSATPIINVRKEVQSLWPSNYRRNSRLYAVGMDSFLLTYQFNRLMALPNFSLDGLTGKLLLNDQQQIVRLLTLARFSSGVPVITTH